MTSAFLASLAVSDLVTVFFSCPSHLVALLSPTWNVLGSYGIGLFACKAVTYMEGWLSGMKQSQNVFTKTKTSNLTKCVTRSCES